MATVDEGRLRFATGIDNEGLKADAEETKRIIANIGKTAEQSGSSMEEMMKKIGKGAAAIFSVQQLSAFARQIFNVRSEIKSLEVAFNTLTGSADVGGKLLKDIREFAVSTPMQMNDLARGAQTLLSFNTAAEDVMPILQSLGDISMGDAQKFQSLTLAFAQMSSTGKLMGQDLLQMINAGFNPLSVISEKTGKSIAELKEEMAKGAISADMVKQAFMDATSEGGKFYDMLGAQSKTLSGSVSNLQGAIQDMLNELGEKSEGIMAGSIAVVTELVKNYEKVGYILMGLVSTYGAYKAAVIAVSVAEKVRYQATLAQMAGYTKFGALMDVLKDKTNSLTKAILKNPYAAAAAAITALAFGIYKLATYETEAEKAHKEFVKTVDDGKKSIDAEAIKIDRLFANLKKAKEGTEAWKNAREKIISQYGSYLNNLGIELNTVKDIADAHIKVKNAILEEARAKQYNTAFEKAAEDAANVQGDIFKKLYDKIMKESPLSNKEEFFETIKRQLTDYFQTGNEEAFKAAVKNYRKAGLDKTYNYFSKRRKDDPYFNTAVGKADKAMYEDGRYILNDPTFKLFDDLKKASASYNDSIQLAERMFGKQDNKLAETAESSIKTIKELRKEYEGLAEDEKNANSPIYKEIKLREQQLSGYKELGEQIEWLQDVEKQTNNNDVVADLEKRISQLQKRRDAITGNGNTNSAARDKEKSKLEQQELQKAIDEYYKALELAEREGALELEQQRINLMDDGYKKTKAQIELDYARRRLDIEKLEAKMIDELLENRKNEWKKANPNANESEWENVKPQLTINDLTEGQQKQLNERRRNADLEYERAVKVLLDDLLKSYETYEQQRNEIVRKYEEERKLLYEEDGKTLKAGVTQGNIDEMKRAEDESIRNLNEQFAQRSSTYRKLMNRIGVMSLNQLQAKLAEAYATLDAAYVNGIDGEELAEAIRTVEQLQEAIANFDKTTLSPADKEVMKWQLIGNAIDNVRGNVSNLIGEFAGLDNETMDILDSWMNLADLFANQMINDKIESLEKATNDSVESASDLAKNWENVGSIVGVFIAAVMSIIRFARKNSDKLAMLNHANEYLNDNYLQNEIDNLDWYKFKEDLADAVEAGGTSIYDFFDKITEGYDNLASHYWRDNLPYLQDIAAKIQTSFTSIKNVFQGDFFGDAEEKLNLYAQQLLQLRLAYEEARMEASKGGKNSDEWQETADNAQSKLEEASRRYYEYIKELTIELLGSDPNSIASQLGEALVNAFEAGTDAARAWGNAVDDIINNMIKEFAIKKILTEPIAEMLNQYTEDWISTDANGNALIDTAAMERDIPLIREALQQLGGDAAAAFNSLLESLGYADDIASRSASASGIAQASQDSVNELNGRMTAIQGHTFNLNNNVSILLHNSNTILNSVLAIEQHVDATRADVNRLRRNIDGVITSDRLKVTL